MTYNMTADAPIARDRMNQRMVREVVATGPSSYTTGGDAISADLLGLGQVFGVYGHLSDGTTILQCFFDVTNQKLLFWVTSSDAQVANGVNLSTFTGILLITGK